MKNLLIFGGTGFLGRKLIEILVNEHFNVCVYLRNPQKRALFKDERIQFMHDFKEWADSSRFDMIINLAGEAIAPKLWTTSRKKTLWTSRVDFTQKIVRKIIENSYKPELVLHASAQGIHQTGFIYELCLAWENALSPLENLGIRTCILRTSLVLDSKEGFIKPLLPLYRSGLAVIFGGGTQIMNWMHIDDYLSACIELIQNKNYSGAIEMSAPESCTQEYFAQVFSEIFGRRLMIRVPQFVLKVVLGEQSILILDGQKKAPKQLLERNFNFKYSNIDEALKNLFHLREVRVP
jgi:uncharacterized protein (TIGR01777 family)